MYDALTTTISAWRERVLLTIDACIEQGGAAVAVRIAEALSQVTAWPTCPRATDISPNSAPASYRCIPLASGKARRYEALLIAWPPGYATPIHDHNELWGMEFVLDGVLEVKSFQLSVQPSLHLAPTHRALAGVGDHVVFCEKDYAHRCRNLSKRRPALSLHVYGGELNAYRSFRRQQGRWSSEIHNTVREASLV